MLTRVIALSINVDLSCRRHLSAAVNGRDAYGMTDYLGGVGQGAIVAELKCSLCSDSRRGASGVH